jgi:hypothetical protein
MKALTFKIETTTSELELKSILSQLDTIVCEILDDENNEDNWMALKSAKECLNSINESRKADCRYTMYIKTIAAQVWANQSYNNSIEDLSI